MYIFCNKKILGRKQAINRFMFEFSPVILPTVYFSSVLICNKYSLGFSEEGREASKFSVFSTDFILQSGQHSSSSTFSKMEILLLNMILCLPHVYSEELVALC